MTGRTVFLQAAVLLALWTGCRVPTPSERSRLLREMAARPADPWPRGSAHMVYGIPGTQEEDKAYEEAGGSFSPAAASFGVSFWIVNFNGRIVATSDSIPLPEVQSRLVWSESKLPGISLETVFYSASWQATREGEYQLRIQPHCGPGRHLQVVVRSVGPAGGPVNAIEWKSHTLFVNNRWEVSFPPGTAFLGSGHEGDANWTTHTQGAVSSVVPDGWGYARVRISGATTIVIRNRLVARTTLRCESVRPAVTVELPDSRFQECLYAQTAHQLMALVSNQTRPGDPMNYPLAWQRDGAFTVTSLARAGRLEVARELASYMARYDFFGGFGAEADAPGLGIWSIEETALLLKDPAFDESVFPAVMRKAGWIEQMLRARHTLRAGFEGPLVSQQARRGADVVADPARDGLIMGRMDNQRPVLFVNAVSYLGLLRAAEMADRVRKPDVAARWRSLASDLRRAWTAGLSRPEWLNNDRTFISGLWPTWMVSDRARWARALDARWAKFHTPEGNPLGRPKWTYFTVAEAHQDLLLGRPERAWKVLEWFWKHQAAPGLYTWWEGTGEENTSRRWEGVRGWAKPPDVEPHYWTAAEMLLLQLDMLAYADEGAGEKTLVIGAGIRPEWLRSPLTVRGISTRIGVVDWRWTGSRLFVHLNGFAARILLGNAFPGNVSPTLVSTGL